MKEKYLYKAKLKTLKTNLEEARDAIEWVEKELEKIHMILEGRTFLEVKEKQDESK